jgi:hypothetical protein
MERTDVGPWQTPDAVTSQRVDRAIKEGRAVKILRPDAGSADGKWEAIGSGFHIWADSYADMCERLRLALGVDG